MCLKWHIIEPPRVKKTYFRKNNHKLVHEIHGETHRLLRQIRDLPEGRQACASLSINKTDAIRVSIIEREAIKKLKEHYGVDVIKNISRKIKHPM